MSPQPGAWIRFGTPEYTRVGWALFLAGFATFSLLYCVQPLLPLFARDYDVTPAASSLTLSLATGALAVSITLAGAFSQGIGRRGVIFVSMTLAAILHFCTAIAPGWSALLAARGLEGFVLGGVPAVAMAYLAEEIEPAHLGKSMGLYVAGTAFGGMMGRVAMGLLSEFVSWRMSMAILAAVCLAAAVGFRLLLPPSRNFVRRSGFAPAFHVRTFARHLSTTGLMRIYVCAFLLMSVFVTVYNYMTFRLTDAPYALSQTAVSMIFLAYGFGIVSSSFGGALGDRFGGRRLLIAAFSVVLGGILFTLGASLVLIVAGLIMITAGFFVGHAVASASVGPLAGDAKGHAAALYLLFYYLGSSISGTAGGWFWQHGGWLSVAAFTGACAFAGLALVVMTRARPQRPSAPV